MNKELLRIAKSIEQFDSRKYAGDGIDEESLRKTYERCLEVSNDLSIIEMQMLWYLRQSRLGETHRFFRIAKQNYEAYLATLGLSYKSNGQ